MKIEHLYIYSPLRCRDVRTFIEANNDVILICTSILSFSEVLRSMPLACLKRQTTLFVDVLSVKEHPRDLLLQVLLYFYLIPFWPFLLVLFLYQCVFVLVRTTKKVVCLLFQFLFISILHNLSKRIISECLDCC